MHGPVIWTYPARCEWLGQYTCIIGGTMTCTRIHVCSVPGCSRIDDIIILRVENGADTFLSVTGKWVRSTSPTSAAGQCSMFVPCCSKVCSSPYRIITSLSTCSLVHVPALTCDIRGANSLPLCAFKKFFLPLTLHDLADKDFVLHEPRPAVVHARTCTCRSARCYYSYRGAPNAGSQRNLATDRLSAAAWHGARSFISSGRYSTQCFSLPSLLAKAL